MGIPQAQTDTSIDKTTATESRDWLWAIALAAIAFAFRLVPVLRGGGLLGLGNYDDGVYYAAATGLVHGRLPYHDFLLLHPPGMPLLLAPFALGAQLTSDSYGFAAARLAWMLLGAVNALLIWRILRPIGLVAALFGGAAGLVRSQALLRISIGRGAPIGLLCIGARRAGRFHPGLSTELLSFLARVLGITISQWLSPGR